MGKSLGMLGRHQDADGNYVRGAPRKYKELVSFGVALDRGELQALREVANRERRPVGELIRGLCLMLLEAKSKWEPDPESPNGSDAATLRAVKKILAEKEAKP